MIVRFAALSLLFAAWAAAAEVRASVGRNEAASPYAFRSAAVPAPERVDLASGATFTF
jgi:hypothetical protein